jgi:hypothetical protein
MTDSADGERLSGRDAYQGTRRDPHSRGTCPPASTARTPTEGPGFSPCDDEPPAHPATEASHAPTDEVGWDHTATVTGGPRPTGSTPPGQPWSLDSSAPAARGPSSAEVRYGPGVPGAVPAGQAGVSAEEVWRTGLPGPSASPGRWRRRAGAALTAALLAACGVVIFLRLHHAPFSVTGVKITAREKNGCAVDVTGRISTSGGAGTVSYQWVLTPQAAAPHPLSQSVTAGQTAVFVTISDQGTGHGQQAQQVTLQVLSPGQGRATTHVVISC